MWDYFKPELTKRLSELSVDDSTSARVRSILTELLPNGEFTIDDVAKKLGYSKQTLQRKLSSENTTELHPRSFSAKLFTKHRYDN